jgi:hypothetical protein
MMQLHHFEPEPPAGALPASDCAGRDSAGRQIMVDLDSGFVRESGSCVGYRTYIYTSEAGWP